MSKEELSNWIRIKETMERDGNTDNFFYKRAAAIADGKEDPLDKLK
jgi:hypothetical protein